MALTSLLPRRKQRDDMGLRRDYEDLYPAFVREMDKLLGHFFSSFDSEPFGDLYAMDSDFMLSVDVKETKKEITVTAEFPVMDKDDIDITLSKDMLTIRVEKKEEAEDTGNDCYRMERRLGSFYRTIPLGTEVDDSEVDARFKKGVLTIRLPKSAEAQKRSKRMQIRSI